MPDCATTDPRTATLGRMALMMAATVCLAFVNTAFAGDVFWNDPNGGDWRDQANWSAGVPGVGDTAQFNLPSQYTVELLQNRRVDQLELLDGDPIFELGGHTLDTANSLTAWPGGLTTSATFRDGTLQSAGGLIGQGSGDDVTITLGTRAFGAPGAQWLMGTSGLSDLVLGGSNGEGQLNLRGGSTAEMHQMRLHDGGLDLEDSTLTTHGDVEIAGDGFGNNLDSAFVVMDRSQWDLHDDLTLSVENNGELSTTEFFVRAQSTLDSHGSDVTLSDHDLGTANVTVEDDSTWENFQLMRVAERGEASLTVGSGSIVDGRQVNTGGHAGAEANVVVEGTGSELDVRYLVLGEQSGSSNTLTIRDEGLVNASSRARLDNGTSTLSLQAGGRLATQNLDLGDDSAGAGSGTATVDIEPGGSIFVQDTTQLYAITDVNLNGGALKTDTLNIDPGANFNFNVGKLHLTADHVMDSDWLSQVTGFSGLQAGQHLRVDGEALVAAPLVVQGGTLSLHEINLPSQLDFQQGTVNFTGPNGLTIGFGGQLGYQVTLGVEPGASERGFMPTQHLNVADLAAGQSNQLEIDDEGLVTVYAGSSIGAEDLVNHGEIFLAHETAAINGNAVPADPDSTGAKLENRQLIRGTGRINSNLTNYGQIRVEPAPEPGTTITSPFPELDGYPTGSGDGPDPGRLVLTTGQFRNHGTVNVFAGQSFEVLTGDPSINETDGAIHLTAGADANFAAGLANQGDITMSNGGGALHGELVNNSAGRISVVENSTGRLFGDLDNEGDIIVGSGSTLLVLGDASGSGDYPGAGEVVFSDRFSPGSSPGSVTFGGDLSTDSMSRLIMELAGYDQGSEFDFIDVAGDATLAGELEIRLLDGFQPELGDTFDLVHAEGTIDASNLTLIGNDNFAFEVVPTNSESLRLTAVPEPGSLALLGVGGLLLLRRRRAAGVA